METIMTVILWALFGLIAGFIARALHPGRDSMGMGATMLLGVMGLLVGGAIAYVLRLGTSPMQPAGWILSIVGAIVLLSLGFFSTRARKAV